MSLRLLVAVHILIAGASSCGSTRATCAETCGGCCRDEVCLDGQSVNACGASGSSCSQCVGNQACWAGRCEWRAENVGGGVAGGVGDRDSGVAGGGGPTQQPLPLSAFDGGCEAVYVNLYRCGLATVETTKALALERCNLAEFVSSRDCINSTGFRLPFSSVPLGGACRGDLECSANAYCEVRTCPGTCVLRKPIGAFANRIDECEMGAELSLQHCASPGSSGISCRNDRECSIGMICTGRLSPTCRPLVTKSLGEPCDDATLCRNGVCNLGKCAPPLTEGNSCVPGALHCKVGLDCVPGGCRNAYPCGECSERCVRSPEGTVTCLPFVVRGGVCSQDDECSATDECNPRNECAQRPGVGEACGLGLPCGPGMKCSSGTCSTIVQLAPGMPCDDDSECANGRCESYLNSRACVAEARLGSACNPDRYIECVPGAYCAYLRSGTTVTQTCERLVGRGEPCAVDDRCMSGHCNNGVCTLPADQWCIVPR